MVDVWLPYGKTEICARIPARNYLGNIEPMEKPSVQDPIGEVKRALEEPIGTKRLSQMAKTGDKVVIVADDQTRTTPSRLIILPILDELNKAGVKDPDVTVVFGCGTHRPVKLEEMKALLGEDTLQRVNAVSHDCGAKDVVYVGKTKTFGTKVYLNKRFAEADLRILTGDICLHYYAGYGGGRKSVLPAVCGEETIQQNHALVLHPKSRTGVMDGNPVHEDMIEAAELADVHFIVNIVTNSKREIVRAFAGQLQQAFFEGVKLVDEMWKVPVEKRADVILVSSGGHPLDIDLYQAYKGLDNALEAVKRGGVIVWAAECPEGFGNDVFYEWMTKFKELREMETEIKRHFRLGGQKAYFLSKALQRANIILVSLMPDYYATGVFKLRTARAVNDALRDAFGITGKDGKVWVMPQGNSTLPVVKSSEEKVYQNA